MRDTRGDDVSSLTDPYRCDEAPAHKGVGGELIAAREPVEEEVGPAATGQLGVSARDRS